MPLKKTTTLLTWLFLLPLACWSQAQWAQVQGYVGTTLFPAANNNALMAGYHPGFTVGAGVTKTVKRFILNPNIEFTATSKEHYSLSLLSIHNNAKYYLLEFSKVRPYAMAVVNISFMNLHQEAFQAQVNPDPSYSVSGPADIPVEQITYRAPDMKLTFAPTFGLGAGIGFDIPVRLKVVPFVQYSYTFYFTKSSGLINDNFPNNSTSLSTQNIVLGIRYSVYK
jgi:hypothetical protein